MSQERDIALIVGRLKAFYPSLAFLVDEANDAWCEQHDWSDEAVAWAKDVEKFAKSWRETVDGLLGRGHEL